MVAARSAEREPLTIETLTAAFSRKEPPSAVVEEQGSAHSLSIAVLLCPEGLDRVPQP
jgi:hypothetical protein